MIRVEQSGYVGRRNIESKLWDCGKKGIAAVNMRTVASECGIALGSLYNYFSSKSELLSATIEAVWKDIFQMGKL